MRLISLEIDNFRVIRRARLELPDQLIGIIGVNGAGKSSLVEAVAWCLYGQSVARSGKEEIRSTYARSDQSCRVGLEFELNGETYLLVRQLVGKNERSEVSLFRNGRPESSGSLDTGKYVVTLLGLDWRGFLTSFLARQQELNGLADLTPGKRRDHLAGMLGVDRLDRAIKRIKDDGRLQADKEDFLYRQTAGREELSNRLKELREHAELLELQVGGLLGAWTKARDGAVELEASYREHHDKKAACSRLEAKLEARRETRKHLAGQRETLEQRRTELESKNQEAARLAGEIKDAGRVRESRRLMEQARLQVETGRTLRNQIESAAAELTRLDAELKERRTDLVAAEKALADLPETLQADLEKVNGELEITRRTFIEVQSDAKASQLALKAVEEQVASIARIGPEAVCDRCHRPFGDDLPGIRTHLEEERAGLEARITGLKMKLDEVRKVGEHLKNNSILLQSKVSTRKELLSETASLRREVGSSEKRRGHLEQAKSELREKLEGLGSAEFDPAELERLTSELNRMEGIQKELHRIEGELKSAPEVERGLKEVAERTEGLDRELADLEDQFRALRFDPVEFEALQRSYAESREKAERARDEHTRAVRDLDLTKAEILTRQEETARLDQAAVELEEVRVERFHTEKLHSLFRDFRKFTISRIRPRLAELAGELLDEMSGGRYSLVELDEDYNLHIMDDGRMYGLDRFSGGEKDLASLCLRLAISLALTESAGLDRSFIILDEVFGSQDTGRRELIFEALARLKERFPQTILITHLEELKNKVEMLIDLEPQPGGWSEVRVNGETAAD